MITNTLICDCPVPVYVNIYVYVNIIIYIFINIYIFYLLSQQNRVGFKKTEWVSKKPTLDNV